MHAPTAYSTRCFIKGEMFNQKGEVTKLTTICSFLYLLWQELNCANNEQLVVSLTQEGVIRKARAPKSSPASKLWSVSSNVVAFNLYYSVLFVHMNGCRKNRLHSFSLLQISRILWWAFKGSISKTITIYSIQLCLWYFVFRCAVIAFLSRNSLSFFIYFFVYRFWIRDIDLKYDTLCFVRKKAKIFD